MAHPFIKIAPQLRKQKMQPLPKKNYSSFADPNYYHSINVMSSCPHAAAETKCYCVTIEVLILCKLKYINDGTNILDNKIP